MAALLLCSTHVGRVKSLESWQKKVIGDELAATELKALWKPSEEMWPLVNKVSSIFEPLVFAFEQKSWMREELEAVAVAMQAWRQIGQVDGLDGLIFRGAATAILGGISQQMRNRDFERMPLTTSRKRKPAAAASTTPTFLLL